MTIKEVSEKYGIPQGTLRYYEKVGLIPHVTRSAGGIRNYQESDLAWVELAKCMRSAGLSVEVLLEYVKLYQQGDPTIPARLSLLKDQRSLLLQQKKQIETALDRLDFKISRYEEAMKTGILSWDDN
ncbi:MAG TPA: MerR family transcriptional regulator [Candidatus Lachnoclostridium pullistercoris]|uniref:MerR family transcriptional regulator n=1 Tax=Candidatus Lachnoclostridium pullistercoris TaxID=2838632 RepID=A0A9D2T5Y3_9FIRM|nr:MerR family transcriptional regulator [Candidatus Lachnoclostridium pullistercoris]